jgi:hypothetical protein
MRLFFVGWNYRCEKTQRKLIFLLNIILSLDMIQGLCGYFQGPHKGKPQ